MGKKFLGIEVTMKSRRFSPKFDVIRQMRPDIKEKAESEFMGHFSDIQILRT